MIKTRILTAIARVAVGKKLGTALMLLKLTLDALENRNIRNVALFVYKQLPESWKAPKGPATEAEFTELIQAGETFLLKVRAVLD